jgi:hypothetical protein
LAERVADESLVANADGNMVPDAAVGIDSAQAGTGVLTLSPNARLVRGAVRVDHTLGPAVGRRANHVREAGALAAVPDHPGRVAVGPAGVRVAGIHIVQLSAWRQAAGSEGVAEVVSQTDAVGDVIDHLALGIVATICLRTGVHAVKVDTGKPGGALGVGGALWPTTHVWVAEVIRDALTGSCIAAPVADSVAATRSGVAWVHWLRDTW